MKFHPVLSAGLLSGAFVCSVSAQETIDSQAVTDLDQIVVTGQKIERSLQDTQASVAVVTAEEIEQRDIQTFRDAFRLMGNVIDADFVDAGFVIRGINSEGLTPGGAPLASVYVDGAAQTIQGARRGSRGLWDVEQIEVYRGPQSTLSGRASLAGAIYVATKDPTFDWEFSARATAGELGTREAAVALGGPLAQDVLAFRVAAEYQERDSEISYPAFEQFVRHGDLVKDEYRQVRGKLLLTPSPELRATLSIAVVQDAPAYDDVAGPGFGFEYSERRGDFNAPYFQDVRSVDNVSSALEVEYNLSSAWTLTSLTTLADSALDRPTVNAGTPGELFIGEGGEDERNLTQEFRFNFETPAVQAVAGLYFADERSDARYSRAVPFGGGRRDTSTNRREADNVALFGELTWRFAQDWRVIAGGRVDHLDQSSASSFNRDNFNPLASDIASTNASDNDETTFLPKAGLVYDFSDAQSLGLTAQRGFRSGGSAIDVNGAGYSFDPEYTVTFEAAYRARLGARTTLNINAFHTDWTDQQVELQLVPGDFTSQVIANAGESRLYGGEIEARTRFTPELAGFLSLGYVNTRFEEFVVAGLGNFSGLAFPEAPERTFAFGIDWRSVGGFFAGFDARYVSDYSARDLQNAPIDRVGDYWVGNLRAGYEFDRWSITFFADNLFDEQYLTYRDTIEVGDPAGPFDCCATLGRSRVAGVTLQFDY